MDEAENFLEQDELVGPADELTPHGFDRSSAQTARMVLEKLLPEQEDRLAVLSFFAHAILNAHQQGESKWGVTLYPNSVALNISGFYACWIRSNDVFVSVIENALSLETRTDLEHSVRWGDTFKRLPDSRYFYVPYTQVGEVLPQLLPSTEAFIVSTAARFARMGVRVEGAHSPGVLKYLREYLEMDLPDPVYLPEGDNIGEENNMTKTGDLSFWKIAPGENGFLWDECRNNNCILIGWPALGNFLSYSNRDALEAALVQGGDTAGKARIIWPFSRDIQLGNIVVANKGNSQVLGVGVVTSDYLPPNSSSNPSSNSEYPNARRVHWRITAPIDLPQAFFGQVPPTVFKLNQQRWQIIRQAYLDQYPGEADLEDALNNLGRTSWEFVVPPPPVPEVPEAVQPLLKMAERTKNILLYGPPGTGKTWLVTQFARAFTDADKVEMVTFHQSFAYEEFVEGVKPVIHEGQMSYAVVDGVFKRVCRTAEKNPDSQYLIIIDEINRANIAKVLGELITLIEDDKRLGIANEVQVRLPYSGERFGVPSNLTILGTMNTADRSIALLDLALRRRFTFVEMLPDPTLLPEDVAGVNLQALLTRLNLRVALLLDANHQIGHSYLMGIETEEDLHFAWYRRIVPLLQEYFYHDGERLQAIAGKLFVRAIVPDLETREALGAMYEDTTRYEIVELAGEAFLQALRELSAK